MSRQAIMWGVRPPTKDEADHLRHELWLWDLIGLADDPAAPADEYDCLIPLLWEAAHGSASPSQQVTKLEEHVGDHFGLRPVAGKAAAAIERTRAWIGTGSH